MSVSVCVSATVRHSLQAINHICAFPLSLHVVREYVWAFREPIVLQLTNEREIGPHERLMAKSFTNQRLEAENDPLTSLIWTWKLLTRAVGPKPKSFHLELCFTSQIA